MTDWKKDLYKFLDEQKTSQQEKDSQLNANAALVRPFIHDVVVPAFAEIQRALQSQGREIQVYSQVDPANTALASITVTNGNVEELNYTIKVRLSEHTAFRYPEVVSYDRGSDRPYRAVGHLRPGTQDYDVTGFTQDEIRTIVLNEYKQSVRHLNRN